jgi:LPXTG-motif cell wall-anchored protein
MRRPIFRSVSAVALATLLFSAFSPVASAGSPPAPVPDRSGFVPDFSQAIPFLGEGESATVGGVVVTATANTAVPGDRPDTYLHQSNDRLNTVLTFDEPILGFRAQIRNHADCTLYAGPDCFEDYRLIGRDSAGAIVFDTSIRNTDGIYPFVPGDGADELSGLIATLEIDYTYDTPVDALARGSFLELWLTDTYLDPAKRTVTGTPGKAIKRTPAFTTIGFAGAVTYKVTGGKLPAGLVLDKTTGVISGTPTEASTATVTITATGATRGTATATITFEIAAEPAPTEELPATGGSTSLLMLGAALLAVGAMLRRSSRRAANA